jgi:hypothetical protein
MRLLTSLFCLLLLSSCAFDHQSSESFHNADLLTAGALENEGMAFITPSTVTGQEEDTQALALAFADVINQHKPAIRVTKLSQTLSLVNSHHLTQAYKKMYDDYRDTGLLNADVLKQIGKVTQSRYLLQLKLSNFRQSSDTRLNLLGLRLTQTNKASIRLFMQIWDSENGTICFEGSEELNQTMDSASEQPISFKSLVSVAASNLITGLP